MIPQGPVYCVESMNQFFADLTSQFKQVADFQLVTLNNSTLTIRSVVLALILLLLGYQAARIMSRGLAKFVSSRSYLNTGAAAAIQSIVFYALVALGAVIALDIAGIPLTAFAFIGGALAIGIGFGSQNVVQNFISGLILFVEQPVRVGDIIEFDGVRGRISRIGARSTILHTGENFDLIVPNSLLLDRRIANLTLRDTLVRRSITVGVAYGSPTDKVLEILQKLLNSRTQIVQSPTPVVLLQNFGASSLDFEMRFWVDAFMPSDINIFESELRLEIERIFRQEKISIAYPTRDIRLFAEQPLQVVGVKTEDTGT